MANQTAPPSTIIPTRLRNALRLIHCLQKERGASSSFYAAQLSSQMYSISENDNNNTTTPTTSGIGASLAVAKRQEENRASFLFVDFLENTMMKAREGTDSAFVIFLSSPPFSACLSSSNRNFDQLDKVSSRLWEESLQRVRACLDRVSMDSSSAMNTRNTNNRSTGHCNDIDKSHHTSNCSRSTSTTPTVASVPGNVVGSHRVVVMFNILLGNIVDETVIKVVKYLQNTLQKEDDDNQSVNSAHSMHHSSSTMELDCSLRSVQIFRNSPNTEKSITPPSTSVNLSRSLPLRYGIINQCDSHYEKHFHETNMYTQSPPVTTKSYTSVSDTDPNYSDLVRPNSKTAGSAGGSDSKYAGLIDGGLIIQGNTRKHEQFELNMSSQSYERQSSKVGFSTEYEYKVPIQLGTPLRSSLIINGEGDKQRKRLRYMLSLLTSFVRLKESIGLERAILSNLMASEVDKQHQSSSKLLTGLVVEDANQRMIIRELQTQSKNIMENKYKVGDNITSLLLLMEDMLRPSKEIDRLQEMIRSNFNLEEFRKAMPFKKFWEVISIYIDKLHSIELILVEELQSIWVQLSLTKSIGCSFDEKKKSQSHESFTSLYTALNRDRDPGKQYLYDILLSRGDKDFDNDISEKEAAREISKLPADQIKHLLISHLQDIDGEINPSNTTTEMIDENLGLAPLRPNPHIMKEWEIDLYEIEFKKRIGRGVGGTTYLAEWSGQNVAVKVAATTDLGLEGWQAEVNSLQRLHHPNVIRLLGSIYNPSPQTYGLVLEYCESGDLSSALNSPTPYNFFWRVAEDVAKGMNYLHTKKILHRDIKPGNVLLNGDVQGGNFTAKLSDFGVSIMHHGSVGEEHTAETGTYRWMPPEIIRHEVYSFAADVYSYALVVWQLVTHEIPFKNFSQIEAAGKVAIEYARPPFPVDTPELIIALIETCWRECPDDRLSFAQITFELREIHRAMSDREKFWLSAENGHPVYEVPQQKDEQSLNSDQSRECDNLKREPPRSHSAKGSRSNRGLHRSKSPSNRGGIGGGLFSIFSNRQRDR